MELARSLPSSDKVPLFTPDFRDALGTRALFHLPRISGFSGLAEITARCYCYVILIIVSEHGARDHFWTGQKHAKCDVTVTNTASGHTRFRGAIRIMARSHFSFAS